MLFDFASEWEGSKRWLKEVLKDKQKSIWRISRNTKLTTKKFHRSLNTRDFDDVFQSKYFILIIGRKKVQLRNDL